MFKPLFESNKVLHSIRIFEDFTYQGAILEKRPLADSTHEILRNLLTNFSSCRTLNFSWLSTEGQEITKQDVGNICGVLPCRGVEMEMEIGEEVSYVQNYKTMYCNWFWSQYYRDYLWRGVCSNDKDEAGLHTSTVTSIHRFIYASNMHCLHRKKISRKHNHLILHLGSVATAQASLVTLYELSAISNMLEERDKSHFREKDWEQYSVFHIPLSPNIYLSFTFPSIRLGRKSDVSDMFETNTTVTVRARNCSSHVSLIPLISSTPSQNIRLTQVG